MAGDNQVNGPTEARNESVDTLKGNGPKHRNLKPKLQISNECLRVPDQKTRVFYGGPLGATLIIVLAPVSVMLLNFMCAKDSCSILKPKVSTHLSDYFDWTVAAFFMIWIPVVALVHSIPLGRIAEGQRLLNGQRLSYRLNGAWCIPAGLLIIGVCYFIGIPLHYAHHKWPAFITGSIILSFVASTYFYLRSVKAPASELSVYGNTGNTVYDFFMGRELNPRIGNFDLKLFCLRYGLCTWSVVDLTLVASQVQQNGMADKTLLLSCLGHVACILDCMVFEETMLTSFTLNHQGTGFLLVFGSFVVVPFVFSFNARFVLETGYRIESEPFLIFLFACLAISIIGHRFTNMDKALFLQYPDHMDVANYKWIAANDGKRILVDGWWATVRHPNYITDILTGVCWCLVTGFNDIIAYIYVIFHVTFTVQHIKQNEDMCHREFGPAWDTYCQRVKYKLIKFVY